MRGVMIEVPADLLHERARTGQDRFDEMWEGVLHMVPPPSAEHQRMELELTFALRGPVEEAGLLLRFEIGLFDPEVAGPHSYRQPDLVVYAPAAGSERGVEGAAALVIEIASPGDESYDKVGFYDRVGVGEVLVVDRDTKAVRLWSRAGGRLVERPVPADGRFALAALSVTARQVGDHLEVATTAAVTRI